MTKEISSTCTTAARNASFSSRWGWYRDLISVLLHKELEVRYKSSILGYLWSIMNPLAQAAVFYLVFSVYMRFAVAHYLVALLAALFAWQWFTNSVLQGPHTFLANPTLVKKVSSPRYIIPLVTVLQDMVHFLISLPVFLVFKLTDGLLPAVNWIWGIPSLTLITFITIYGICLLLGTLNLFLRDIGNLVGILVNILFFSCPIMYVLDVVPKEYLIYFKINPIAPLFISWRALLLNNTFGDEFLLLSIGYAAIFLVMGIWVYKKLEYKFAEVM